MMGFAQPHKPPHLLCSCTGAYHASCPCPPCALGSTASACVCSLPQGSKSAAKVWGAMWRGQSPIPSPIHTSQQSGTNAHEGEICFILMR